jgi:hypothetical protein
MRENLTEFLTGGNRENGDVKKSFLKKFVFYARPHLLSSPPGEEMAFVCFWVCG